MTNAEPGTRRGQWLAAGIVVILAGPVLVWLFLLAFGRHKCVPLPYLGEKSVAENGDTLFHRLPPFRMTSQTGAVFTDDSLRGYIHVADFVFTRCPGICKDLSKNMAKLQEKILEHKDIRLVSYSVDPQFDGPEVLSEYARRYGARPDKWTLLTGDSAALRSVALGGYMAPFAPDSANKELITHSPLFFLVDKDLHVRGYYRIIDGVDGQKEFKRLLEHIDVLRCQYRNP